MRPPFLHSVTQTPRRLKSRIRVHLKCEWRCREDGVKIGRALARSKVCMRGIARPNCHMLTLSHLAASRGKIASMPAAGRPCCILRARDLESCVYFRPVTQAGAINFFKRSGFLFQIIQSVFIPPQPLYAAAGRSKTRACSRSTKRR